MVQRCMPEFDASCGIEAQGATNFPQQRGLGQLAHDADLQKPGPLQLLEVSLSPNLVAHSRKSEVERILVVEHRLRPPNEIAWLAVLNEEPCGCAEPGQFEDFAVQEGPTAQQAVGQDQDQNNKAVQTPPAAPVFEESAELCGDRFHPRRQQDEIEGKDVDDSIRFQDRSDRDRPEERRIPGTSKTQRKLNEFVRLRLPLGTGRPQPAPATQLGATQPRNPGESPEWWPGCD